MVVSIRDVISQMGYQPNAVVQINDHHSLLHQFPASLNVKINALTFGQIALVAEFGKSREVIGQLNLPDMLLSKGKFMIFLNLLRNVWQLMATYLISLIKINFLLFLRNMEVPDEACYLLVVAHDGNVCFGAEA